MALQRFHRGDLGRLAQAWLATLPSTNGEGRPRLLAAGGEQVLLMTEGYVTPGQQVSFLVAVRGDLSCGQGCRFERPFYAGGNCVIGNGTVLEAAEAEGNLVLSSSVEVRDYVSCRGRLDIQCGCRIAGAAASGDSIRLALHAEASRLHAPLVVTPAGATVAGASPAQTTEPAIEFPAPCCATDHSLERLGIERRFLEALAADRWVYRGDLHFERPVLLSCHLAVHGAFSCPDGSLLNGDLHARGSLALGARTLALGNMQAGGDLLLAPGCVFQASVQSSQMIHIRTGSRGFRKDGPVLVQAAGEVALEEGVSIKGDVVSGYRVVTVPAERRDS